MAANSLKIERLSIGFPDRPVVENLTGEFPGRLPNLVLGRCGSGKTTLLMTLAGFLAPLAGKMFHRESEWKPEGKTCLAFQNPEKLFFCPTVGDEVTFALLQRGNKSEKADEDGRSWLDRWGVDQEKYWLSDPFRLSGGQKRRVALAACTVFKPDVILLDEPLAGLDFEGRRLLVSQISSLAEERIVVIVTHDPEPFFPNIGTVLLLSNNRGSWYEDGKHFLRDALDNSDIYPLPPWYRAALFPYLPVDSPPSPVAEEVARFISERGRRV